ncbi:MAG TPA: MoxR family ATPase [Myxococcota bacterium]|nr:MoxR family ATPase [Myxococcota bacterium]
MTDDVKLLEELSETRTNLLDEISKVIVGQRRVVELMLTALFAQGHCLFIGVPGLAKTLLVSTTARALGLGFKRVQFTPDLMPSDITGTEVLDEDRATGHRELRFVKGPVFTNMMLADEINRTPPKTQAALLQAMQEREVSVGGNTFALEPPFQVFATQNPIEQEGTYPLPEAQLDRFMLSIQVDYPSAEEEIDIVLRTTTGQEPEVQQVIGRERLLAMQGVVRRINVSRAMVQKAVELARATRPGPEVPDTTREWVQWGAGPRASQYLVVGAKVWAALHGNESADVADLAAVAPAVLGHRVLLNFQAEATGLRSDAVVQRLIAEVL